MKTLAAVLLALLILTGCSGQEDKPTSEEKFLQAIHRSSETDGITDKSAIEFGHLFCKLYEENGHNFTAAVEQFFVMAENSGIDDEALYDSVESIAIVMSNSSVYLCPGRTVS